MDIEDIRLVAGGGGEDFGLLGGDGNIALAEGNRDTTSGLEFSRTCLIGGLDCSTVSDDLIVNTLLKKSETSLVIP